MYNNDIVPYLIRFLEGCELSCEGSWYALQAAYDFEPPSELTMKCYRVFNYELMEPARARVQICP